MSTFTTLHDATLHDAGRAAAPPVGHARVMVCRDGVFLPGRRGSFRGLPAGWRDLGGQVVTREHGLLLPSCRNSDRVLAQPPLALSIDERHIAALLRAEPQGVLAATNFGPPQDKSRNEDFALAAVIVDRRGLDHAFAAVADGVTSKTFWAERSSRIACLVALQVAVDHVDDVGAYSVDQIGRVREDLGMKLRQTLELDHRRLIAAGAVPPDWDPDSFARFCSKPDLWYNSTLLMTLTGSAGGLLLWAGDGGIRIEKRRGSGPSEVTTPLRSTDDVSVSNIVSLSGPIVFTAGRVDTASRLDEVIVTLCTDGPDRTLQRNSDAIDLAAQPNSIAMANALDRLSCLPRREVDNYSAAVARWPLSIHQPVAKTRIDELLWHDTRAPLGSPPIEQSAAAKIRHDQLSAAGREVELYRKMNELLARASAGRHPM